MWNRKYCCSGIAARSRLRLRPPPLLGYRTSVMMSRASSEPRDDSHVLLERPACAHHRAQGPGVAARAEVDVGGECRRNCSPPAQMRDQCGPVGLGSYSWSMLSMQARVPICCLGLADVFGDVMGEEGWLWWRLLLGVASITPAPLPSCDHHRARLDLLYTLRPREGAATHQGTFGMVGAKSSYCSLPKATLRAATRCM